LHHLASLHGPVQRAPAAQPGFPAAFFLAAKAGCDAASAVIMIREAIAIAWVMINSRSGSQVRFRTIACGYAGGQVRIDQGVCRLKWWARQGSNL
jgi:hypothetical protein